MRTALPLFLAVAGAIIAAWWWLGSAVEVQATGSEAKLYCVSYSPFRGDQTPFDLSTHIDPRQIEDDLVRLSQITDCVRTYSTDFGLDRVAEVAARHNMKVIQGAWLGSDVVRNRREIATAVALAKRFPGTIRSIVVGNECLLRGEISPTDLADMIRAVKAQVSAPVTYADVWEFWLRYREVYDAVDFVTIHILPYWEDFPIPARIAAAHVDAIRRKLIAAFPAKQILIGEVGWPSAGRMREGALPSPINQAQVIADVLALAARDHFPVNLIEAFDQPWKQQLEGTVGGHWGLLDGRSREPKFTSGAPVSNHPGWRWQAAGGVAFAAVVFCAALAARRGEPTCKKPMLMRWIAGAVIALVSGVLIGWAIESVLLESLGVGGWARSIAMAVVAASAPVVGTAALMRREVAPRFEEFLTPDRPVDPIVLALGYLFAALCILALETALGLSFDPRYRDFPFAPLSAAACPFLVLSFAAPMPLGRRAVAETMMAAVLTGCALYIAVNESFANWQALWVCVVLLALAVTLFRARDGRS